MQEPKKQPRKMMEHMTPSIAAALEGCAQKKPAVVPEFGSLLVENFASGKASTGKCLNGSVLVYLCEREYFGEFPSGLYEDALAQLLRVAHKAFLEWKKHHKLQVTQPRFTVARVGRKNRMMYPVLSSKAAASKVISFWLTECSVTHAAKADSTDVDKMVATCCRSYSETLRIQDTSPIVMPQEDAERYYRNGMTHLQTYSALHQVSRGVTGRHANRCLWLLICKHHHFFHHVHTTRRERLNPAMSQLLCAEDFIGKMGRIARVTHRQAQNNGYGGNWQNAAWGSA
eukprot:s419_g10.t1